MSQRNVKRLESLRRRIHLLTLTIDNATSERERLRIQASLLTAKLFNQRVNEAMTPKQS